MSFESFPEQEEAKRLLAAALAEGPAHAYLFHGPPGVGKRRAATAFAGELIGDAGRVHRGTHPDLYELEPVGDQVLIDEIRALRRDLHMRPFEADRRVYLVLDAHLLNEDAADALLKDLEEPPSYAVIVLVASELGPLPPTILSRCQLIPFRRLSEHAVREWIAAQAPDRSEEEVRVLARASGGRLDRARRLLDTDAAARRDSLIAAASSASSSGARSRSSVRTAASDSRRNGTSWQRERIVSGSGPRSSATSTITAYSGGSSRSLSNASAAASFIVCASRST